MNRPTESKINYTAVTMSLINIIAVAGYIRHDYLPHILSIVNILGPILIVTFRTWFTEKKG